MQNCELEILEKCSYKIPNSIWFRFSERKRKASNRGEFQPLVSSDQEESEDDGLVVDENPKSRRQKSGSQPALKLKLSSKLYVRYKKRLFCIWFYIGCESFSSQGWNMIYKT